MAPVRYKGLRADDDARYCGGGRLLAGADLSLFCQQGGSGAGTLSLVSWTVGRAGACAPCGVDGRPFSASDASVVRCDGTTSADAGGFVGGSLKSAFTRRSFWCGGDGGAPSSPSELSCFSFRGKGCSW